jgi:predicted ATPase
MKISKLEVQNFKSFDKQEFAFNNVNVIIGANASGKSNFIDIFEFLQQIKKNGIQQAAGNVNDLLNFNTTSREFRIKIEIKPNMRLFSKISLTEKVLVKNTSLITYELTVRTKNRTSKEFTFKEELMFHEYFSINNELGEELERHDKIFKYGVNREFNETFNINTPNLSSERFFYADDIEEINLEFDYQAPFHQRQTSEELNHKDFKKRSILEYQGLFMPPDLFNFGIYDINSKVLKEKTDNSYSTELSKNGDNLPIIIKNILESDDAEQFVADVAGILDFIENIKIIPFESHLELRIKERYNQQETRGNLISDGTVCAIAFIVVLYYQDNAIIFLEEPEHSLHPSLIDDIIRAAYDVAEFLDKQIIITTHSPDLLRHLKNLNNDLKDLTMISRDEEDGNSILEKPIEKEMVKLFLEAELGIDELFIQNLLED